MGCSVFASLWTLAKITHRLFIMKRLLWSVVLIALAPSASWAQPKEFYPDLLRSSPKFLEPFKDICKKPSASTVRVLCNDRETALGMIVGSDGWILTKADDLRGVLKVRVPGNKVLDAELVGLSPAHDLALLKVDADHLTPAQIYESTDTAVGSFLACVGTGVDPVGVGVVSVATRKIPVKTDPRAGSKGAYLGISFDTGEKGVKISQVLPNTPAAKVGLRAGDVILELAGVKVETNEVFLKTIAQYKPGDSVTLKVQRGDNDREFRVTLGNRPPIRSEVQNRMGGELSNRRTGFPLILQHDTIVKPQDCGGPIVDLEGRVIGLNICRAGRTESYAIPGEVIKPLVEEMKAGKHPPTKGFLLSHLSLEEKIQVARYDVRRLEKQPNASEKARKEAREHLQELEEEARSAREKTIVELTDDMVRLIRERLVVMNEVAAYKWSHRQEIFDLDRERQILKQLTARARDHSLPPEVVKAFFQTQLEAAKLLQENAIAEWQKDGSFPAQTQDLKKSLRPRLDQISEEMLSVLGKMQFYLYEPVLQNRLRSQGNSVLTGNGITEEIRDKALAWLRK